MKEEEKLIFKFELADDNNDIDLRTLTEGFGKYCYLMYLINNMLNDSAELDIKVEAVRPGSFEVAIKLWEYGPVLLGTALAIDSHAVIDAMLTIYNQFLELKKHLGNEKAVSIQETSGGQVIVTNGNHNNITINKNTLNFYIDNNEASNVLSSGTYAVIADKSVESIKVQRKKGLETETLVDIPRSMMSVVASDNPYLKPEEETVIKDRVKIIIRSANVDADGAWKCIYNDQKVYVSIDDPVFNSKVKNNLERFGNKDVLIVKLEVKRIREPGTPYWKDVSYKILHVYRKKNLRDYVERQQTFSFNEPDTE
ncbi:MAG: hypothetical protein RRY12_12715 [Cloacibacillus sp.]